MHFIRVLFVVLALLVAAPLLACDACGTGCCCPFNCHEWCQFTEFKCFYSIPGGLLHSCHNVGSQCPWSGCGGFSGCSGLLIQTEVVDVVVGEAIPIAKTESTMLARPRAEAPSNSADTPR